MKRENNAIQMRTHSFSITDCLDYMKRSDLFSKIFRKFSEWGWFKHTTFIPSNFLKESHHTII